MATNFETKVLELKKIGTPQNANLKKAGTYYFGNLLSSKLKIGYSDICKPDTTLNVSYTMIYSLK